ncbi:peptidase inhibitor family I36 protein [Streptomyces sp. URMC 126]|uniref:peptidase inhibitor family I36 protein n=1 Tax=Streptomyces sp. URMC 126 TaxID=3423401 RepID=UPI003F1B845E
MRRTATGSTSTARTTPGQRSRHSDRGRGKAASRRPVTALFAAVTLVAATLLGLAATPAAAADCPSQNLCLFTGPDFTGTQFNIYRCDTYALSNWEGYGSWINNQSPGTRAQFLDQNKNVVYTTPGAYSAASSYDWTPVWYVRNC